MALVTHASPVAGNRGRPARLLRTQTSRFGIRCRRLVFLTEEPLLPAWRSLRVLRLAEITLLQLSERGTASISIGSPDFTQLLGGPTRAEVTVELRASGSISPSRAETDSPPQGVAPICGDGVRAPPNAQGARAPEQGMDDVTHYAQLAEAVEYPREPGEDLVLRGSRATLDDLVAYFVDDDLDGFGEAHPGVSNYHIEQVADILADLLRDVPNERNARTQLKKQACWALLSERVSRLIELEEDDLSEMPTGTELLTMARRTVQQLEPERGIAATQCGGGKTDVANLPGNRRQSSALQTQSSGSLQQVLAELTGISSRVRNNADQLQAHLPIHASYARELATRLDEIVSEAAELDR